MSKIGEAMPSPVDRRRLKDRIVENVSKAVKQIQEVHFCAAGTTDLVFNNQDWQFCKLVEHLDHAFLHGLRHITNGYWVIVQEFTHKATVKEIKRLTNVTTNIGRGRAWLYLALMDHLLESYLRCFTSNTRLVKKYYVKEALVLDQQRMEILLTLAAGLEYMTFQLEADVPYLDLSSHMRSRTSSIRREMSDDQLSLCSMDSSMSQSSSMNTEGQSALGDLMEISSHSSSFEEHATTEAATSSYAADGAPKFVAEDSLQVEIRERTERLAHISATVATPDPMNPEELEVVHVKAKLHRSKKKRSQKKKAECDPERSSVNSLTSSSPMTLLTPDSCYRSGEENISLDEAQEVFASETNSVKGNCATNTVEENGNKSDNRTVVHNKSDCDKPKCDLENISYENCDDFCYQVCDKVENCTKMCDKKTEGQSKDIPQGESLDKSVTGIIMEEGKGSNPNQTNNESNSSSPRHNAEIDPDTNTPNEEDELNTSISIYDSPMHHGNTDLHTPEQDELPQNHLDHTDLANKLSKSENLVLVKDVGNKSDLQNENESANDTPSSSLTNNDSGCDLDGQIVEEVQGKLRNGSSPEMDDNTLVEEFETLKVTDEQTSDSGKEGAAVEAKDIHSEHAARKMNAAVIEDITSHNSPVRSLHAKHTLHHPAEIKVDNNLLLLMMLSIFKVNGEQFIKLFKVSLGHTEGEMETVALLITSHAVYILAPAPGDVKYTVHSIVQFQHIDYLSLGLNYQSIQIVCTNRRNQHWITTGDSQLTRCIVGHLDNAMRESVLNLTNLTVLTDATNQKIALKKWVAKECKIQPNEVRVACYILGHWENKQTDGVTIGACREGMLMYKDQPSYMGLGGAKWKPGFFVLKNGAFYQYEDSSRSTPPLTCIKLNGEECVGCRRSPQGERPYSFELVLSSGGSLQMAASSTKEQQEWLQSLCQAVSEGMGVPILGGCLPSCIVVTTNKLLLCHEDTQTNFFRTLASANITDIASQSTDPVPHNYVLLTFESSSEEGDCEKWTFYFNAQDETETFSQAVGAAWKEHFQVDLPRTDIADLSVLQHCREVLAKLNT